MQKLFYGRYLLLFLALFVIGFFGVSSYKAGRPSDTGTQTNSSIQAIAITPGEVETHRLGKADGAYTLIYYIDYDCPYCKEYLPTLKKEVETYTNLRVVLRNLPLSDIHPTAYKKAVLVECLVRNGHDFFVLLERVYDKQGVPAGDLTASDLGIKDEALIRSCVDDKTSQADVTRSQRGAMNLGLYTTPSVILLKDDAPIMKMNYASDTKLHTLLNSFLNSKEGVQGI